MCALSLLCFSGLDAGRRTKTEHKRFFLSAKMTMIVFFSVWHFYPFSFERDDDEMMMMRDYESREMIRLNPPKGSRRRDDTQKSHLLLPLSLPCLSTPKDFALSKGEKKTKTRFDDVLLLLLLVSSFARDTHSGFGKGVSSSGVIEAPIIQAEARLRHTNPPLKIRLRLLLLLLSGEKKSLCKP